MTVIFGLFPGDENTTCQTWQVTCTISTHPAVLTLKLVSGSALKEITLYLLLDLADIRWGGLRDDPKEGLRHPDPEKTGGEVSKTFFRRTSLKSARRFPSYRSYSENSSRM